jgi:hypothetical protein
MKGFLVATLLVASVSTQAAKPNRGLLGSSINQLSRALVCDTFQNDLTGVGKAIKAQCANQAAAEFAAVPERKSLRECIKPGNVIDDDVRKCMKGM